MRAWVNFAAVAVAVILVSSPALAQSACGAKTHERYGETRAYFTDVLATCRPDRSCAAVVALKAPNENWVMGNTLRILREAPNARYQIEFIATDPAPVDASKTTLNFARRRHGLPFGLTEPNGSNSWRVNDQAVVDAIVADVKNARVARWTFPTADGQDTTEFPLRGMTAALKWIDCMGADR